MFNTYRGTFFFLEICKKTLDCLGWVGFADFDILEKGDGDYRIIEINPRIPASVHAAAISGVHFGEMIVKDITESTIPEDFKNKKIHKCWQIKSENQ